jgi:hypothetical protein
MTDTTTIQETKVLWDKTADKLYVWDAASGAWELFFVAADLVTNDALTDDLALKVSIAGDTMTGALELPNIGVNTTPDATNKLAVKSNAALLAALETGAGGSGDIRAVVSKQAAGNTASFLFQDDYSGRAEIGLCGDDNFHFKVSPDGSSWVDALSLDRSSGQVTLAASLTLNRNALALPAPPGGTTQSLIQMGNADGTPMRFVFDAFGSQNIFTARRCDGTNAAKSGVASNAHLFQISGLAYGTTGYGAASSVIINLDTTENQTDTAQGAAIHFNMNRTGTVSQRSPVSIYSAGLAINGADASGSLFTVSALAAIPAVELVKGLKTFVTDAKSPTFAAAVTGGGSVYCPVYYDGATWRCG